MNIEQFRDVKRIGEESFLFEEQKRKFGLTNVAKAISFETRFKELQYGLKHATVEGFNLEFGVHRGLTLNYLADLDSNREWYGFDTFEGVNEPWVFGDNDYNIDMKNFDLKGNIPSMRSNVTLVQGLFQDTLEDFIQETLKDSPISFLHLDADIYSATKYVLDKVNQNIVPGTIIRFDELCCWRHEGFEDNYKTKHIAPTLPYTKWREGEWKALLEWLEENDREVEPLWRAWFEGAGVKVIK